MTGTGRTIALIVAAGSGTRTGTAVPKQYRKIAGKSLLAHAIDHLRQSGISDVQVVIGADQEALYAEAIGSRSLPPPVTGGATRQISVRNGLESIADSGVNAVLIHDAARPFVRRQVVERLLQALEEAPGAVPVLPAVDTLARGGEELGDIVDRSNLFRVQTPQAFRLDAILGAHRCWDGAAEATDDAQIARAAGYAVALVEGDEALAKLTYPADFKCAEARAASGMISRTGMGFDVHAFADGEELWLGGLRIPHDKGLSGHSDADVLLHALTDALLGAAGDGDIGDHFPPSDPQWKGAPSSRFLDHARALVERKGGIIDHVDATIICEAPKIGPHREALRAKVSELLRLPTQRVSIKATTTEQLGFTGRGEGIAVQALATIRLPEDL
jgi:2-C-methyl-D-erythritol 4-phosphate cytidylyltransferase/2-C-methyl-D-erythritol 2,4-cyclodiphosphate synthase